MMALGALPCIAAPFVWLGFRGAGEAADRKNSVEYGIEFRAALRMRQFWILSLMAIGMSLGVGGLLVHVVPLLTDLGSDRVQAAGAIYGWQYSVFVLGYGFSPFFVGLMRDSLGNYDLALLVSAIAIVSAGILAPFMRVPPERFRALEPV